MLAISVCHLSTLGGYRASIPVGTKSSLVAPIQVVTQAYMVLGLCRTAIVTVTAGQLWILQP